MKNSILNDLNKAQAEAVKFTGEPLLIIAGAGSGKTKVITMKIAYLIEEMNYSPLNILGVTFTNKAANEMKSRITEMTGLDPRLFNISTFHSLGLRILREAGKAYGYDHNWSVGDDKDQKKVIEKYIKEKFSYFTNDMADDVIKKINREKMNLNYPNNKDILYRRGLSEAEIDIFSYYYNFQKENKVWDFEDLISLPVILMRNDPGLRKKYETRFKYVMVDEFQDTNPNQYELMKSIASGHRGITVVGDDDQAIYSWRGANIRFLLDFEKDFKGTKILKLERNYRSTKHILSFANKIIRKNRFRKYKEMWTEKDEGNPVTLYLTSSKESEAENIGDLIEFLLKEKPEIFPVAILYRINSQSFPFETVFQKRDIDYRIVKGLRFFDRKEIKDTIALLKLTLNIKDDISFVRVTDFLPLGIGEKTMSVIRKTGMEKKLSLMETLKNHFPEKFSSKPLFENIFKLNEKKDEMSVSEILSILLNVSGYIDYLKRRGENDRLFNIDELKEFIEKWELESENNKDFSELLDRLSLESGGKEEKRSAKVLLLTMHNSKGLEYPTVIIAGANSTFLPFFMRKGQSEIEEERRLLYVASTRAVDRLIISTGGPRESKFLSETDLNSINIAYSYGELLNSFVPSGQFAPFESEPEEPEKIVSHPIFGEGVIIKQIDDNKILINFSERGEKLIDTSIVNLQFHED